MNSNYITSLDVTLYVPEPPALLVFATGIAWFLFLLGRYRPRGEDRVGP